MARRPASACSRWPRGASCTRGTWRGSPRRRPRRSWGRGRTRCALRPTPSRAGRRRAAAAARPASPPRRPPAAGGRPPPGDARSASATPCSTSRRRGLRFLRQQLLVELVQLTERVELVDLVELARLVEEPPVPAGLDGDQGGRRGVGDLERLLGVRLAGLPLLPAVQPLRRRRERYQCPGDEDLLQCALVDRHARDVP